MYEIDCAESLHITKGRFRKQYMAMQCQQLERGLDQAIEATKEFAPVRVAKTYFPQRAERLPRDDESKWEEAIWRRWSHPEATPAPDWNRILYYQVMLRDTNKDLGWGEIDLIGIREELIPVVVELKIQESITPASTMVQGVAYAIAIQKAWRGRLRQDWNSLLQQFGFVAELPHELNEIDVVLAAPTSYWSEWLSAISNSPRARTVKEAAWHALCDLRRAFERAGYRTKFVELRHRGQDDRELPLNLEGVVVELCPDRGV